MTFGSNAGTTQIDRDAASLGGGNNTVLSVGGGGITVAAGAGAVTFGSLATERNQRVTIRALADFTVANNSSNNLSFIRDFDNNNTGSRTITVAGSGNGDTIFNLIGQQAGTGSFNMAMTINKTSGTGVVRFNGVNTYSGPTTLTAGTLSVGVTSNLGAAAANLVFNGGNLQITGTTLSNFSGIGHAVSFTAAKAVGLDINDAAHTFTVDQVLNQTTGGFNKLGAGTAILNQTNTYTGDTTVTAGMLALADNAQLKFVLGATSGVNNRISGAGTVTLNGDFVVDTAAADALPSGSWTIVDNSTLTETYGSTFTVVGFTNAGGDKWTKEPTAGKLYTFDETTGILTLETTASAYDTWKAANTPGSNPDNDTDGDGVTNAVEFVLGGTSATNDIDKLPKFAANGTNVTFTFFRKQSSIDAKTALLIETSTDLTTWNIAPSAYTVPDGVTAGPPVTVVKGVPVDFDTVTLTMLQDPAKKFARLKVVITP